MLTYVAVSRCVPVEVPKSIGTEGAVKALLSGTIDLGLASRPLTAEAVRSGSYPWVKQLTFIYKGTLSDRAKAFVAFASSAEGRAIIAENGGTTLD